MRLDLDAIDTPPSPQPAGTPRLIALDDIDEDPAQPRTEFDDESLAGLAATIAERGVRQPVSVRPHPSQPGRWMLNFGARRLRASRLAGRADIPAFVDETADSYDQVIENEQREPMRPLDLALFVQRRLALGETQAEIARRLGKSRQYVGYATALIDAPGWLMQAYREGRCRGLQELHELRRLHADHAEAVETLAGEGGAVTRTRVAELRQSLAAGGGQSVAVKKTTRHPAPALELRAELDGEAVVVVTSAAPPTPGRVFVRTDPTSSRTEVDVGRLKLLGLFPVRRS